MGWRVATFLFLLVLPTTYMPQVEGKTIVSRDTSTGEGQYSAWYPNVLVDTTQELMIVLAQNNARSWRGWAYVCELDGSQCKSYAADAMQGSQSGWYASAEVHPANGKVYYASQNTANFNGISMFACDISRDGAECTHYDVAAATGLGSQSGWLPQMAIDPTSGRICIASEKQAFGGPSPPDLGLNFFLCNPDGTGCSVRNVVGSGVAKALGVDTVNNRAVMLHSSTLYQCGLDGSPCASLASISHASGISQSCDLQIDSTGGNIYIIAASGSSAWLTVCDLDGGSCVETLLPTGGAGPIDSASLALDLAHNQVMIATQNNLVPMLYTCDISTSPPSACTEDMLLAGQTLDSTSDIGVGLFSPVTYVAYTTSDGLRTTVVSPTPSITCPVSPFPNGVAVYDLFYPDWIMYPTCNHGFGLVGFPTRRCESGAADWSGPPPVCVPSVGNLTLTIGDTRGVAGETLTISFALQGGPGGSSPPAGYLFSFALPGTGLPPPPVSVSYLDAVFTVTFDVPTGAGGYPVEILVSDTVVATMDIVVAPSGFAGTVSGDRPTFFETPCEVKVPMEDKYGNPRAFTQAEIQRLITGELVSETGAISPASVGTVARPDGGLDALLRATPTLLTTHTFVIWYQGNVTASLSVPVSCGPGYVPVGLTCVVVTCNENSVDIAPPTAVGAECVCDMGYTLAGRDNNSVPLCTPCPEGARCARGLDPPLPDTGFFDQNGVFLRCKRPNACRGGTVQCDPGYEGYMCNTCSADYFSDTARNCVRCPSSPGTLLSGTLAGLGVGALLVAGAIGFGVGRARDRPNDDDLRKRTLPAALSMVLVSSQYIGILGSSNFRWSSSAQNALVAFNVVSIDAGMFGSTECALTSFHIKYALSVLLPLALLVLVFLGLVLLKCLGVFGLGQLSIKALADSVVFSVASLAYIPVAKAVFVIFDCSKLPNGDAVLDADPGVLCFDSAWWKVAWLGAGGLVTFVFGIPAYYLFCLHSNRRHLLDPATFARYGALYRLYRVPFYLSGVVDIGKRLIIVGVSTFASDYVVVQIFSLMGVLGTALVYNQKFHPFYYPLYNALDFRLTLIVLWILLLGVGSYAERNTASSDEFFLIAILVTLGVLAVVSVHAVVADVLQIARERQKVYSAHNDRVSRLIASLHQEGQDLTLSDMEFAFEQVVGTRRRNHHIVSDVHMHPDSDSSYSIATLSS